MNPFVRGRRRPVSCATITGGRHGRPTAVPARRRSTRNRQETTTREPCGARCRLPPFPGGGKAAGGGAQGLPPNRFARSAMKLSVSWAGAAWGSSTSRANVTLNRPCALKMILAGAHAGKSAATRFRVEAEAVARVVHPGIVQIHHIGEVDGLPFLELEYLPGGSLGSALHGTPRPAAEAARMVETLASAIAAAHRQGIIHRDLKPSNILLEAGGQPKVADFGLAKFLDSESGLTRSDLLIGTPSYMAPEQAEGNAGAAGLSLDIYSLGAILYELPTGRSPFRKATTLETLEQVKTLDPVAPSRLQPGVPRDLDTICLKCLQKTPARRATAQQKLGTIYQQIGRITDARRQFEQALLIAERLASEESGRLVVLECLCIALGQVDHLNLIEDRPRDATPMLKRSVEIAEQIAAADPHRPEFRAIRCTCHERLGHAYQWAKQADVASVEFQKMHDLAQAWVADEPQNPRASIALVRSYVKLGDIWMELGDPAQSRHNHGEAIAVCRARSRGRTQQRREQQVPVERHQQPRDARIRAA